MIIWPLWRFWTFTPWGWLAGLLWNCCEWLRLPCPFAPTMFGLIIGCKGKRVE